MTFSIPNRFAALILLVAISSTSERVMATEQVPYVVERAMGNNIELRKYGPTVVAETLVDDESFQQAGNSGFRLLAAYIFGANRSRKEIAMTAPVAMAPEQGERIAMTAPVARMPMPEGGWRMAFYMPAGYTLATLPVPNDSRITLRNQPARRVAALRFSGRGTDEQFAERTLELMQSLKTEGVTPVGQPWTARYNAPWVLPPLRRNEIMIEVSSDD